MSHEFSVREIGERIFFVRGHRVMLDSDLATLYGVETRALNQAVRRNLDRFPDDFMLELNRAEFEVLRSQFVTSKPERRGGRQKTPLVFTEQGVAMLSSVLRSKRAVQVNIAIMRAFVKLREMLDSNRELARKVAQLERKYDGQFKIVFEAIREILHPKAGAKRRPVGIKWE